MNKKIISFLLAAVMVMAMVLTGCEGNVEPTKPPVDDMVLDTMCIVLPAEPTTIEQTAATELQTYIRRISGTELEILTEGDAVATGAIYLGATDYATTNAVEFPDNEFGEGWALKVIGKDLVVTGGAKRGVLYGVYHLLEDYLGVRWWTYWDEYIPLEDESRIPGDLDVSGVPALLYRDIYGSGSLYGYENIFCVRNRLNGDSSNAPAEYGSEESFGRPAHVHTFNRYIKANDYNTHPEWFAFWNGGRISNGQLCLSNEELAMEFTNRVLKTIEESFAEADFNGKNRPFLFSITPNDLPEFCQCSECVAIRKEHGESGELLLFVNKIAETVAHYYPEVYIETLAYWQYVDVPLSDVKPADNVVIRLADTEMDVLHSINHFNNEKTLQRYKDWAAICPEGQLYLWEYNVFYDNIAFAPNPYKYVSGIKTIADLGFNGYFGEQEGCVTTDFWDMKFWMISKLLEDPYQDADALADEFLNGFYGDAGPFIRQYLDMAYEKSEASSAKWSFGAQTGTPRFMKVEDIIAAEGYFNQALEAVAGDETLEKRVRHARCCLDRVIYTSYEIYEEQAAESGVNLGLTEKEVLERFVATLEEQVAMRGQYDSESPSILDIYRGKLERQG